jgi:hypothetical protein
MRPARVSFEYTVIRVVPHVERGEYLNAGVILFCKACRYLGARVDVQLDRLPVFCPAADRGMIRAQLEMIGALCDAGEEVGEFSTWTRSERFRWLAAPSSTVIQTSPVHCGLCADPKAELDQLYDLLVALDSQTVRDDG